LAAILEGEGNDLDDAYLFWNPGSSESQDPPDHARLRDVVPEPVGSVGDGYENAMIEAFWSGMQVELLDSRRWKIPSTPMTPSAGVTLAAASGVRPASCLRRVHGRSDLTSIKRRYL
jgi:hypothetical protein